MMQNIIRLESQNQQAIDVVEKYCANDLPREVVDSAVSHLHCLLVVMNDEISELSGYIEAIKNVS